MSKYFKQSKLLLFTFFILMLAASCEDKEKKEEPGSPAVIENEDAGKGKEALFTEGKLDTLYIDRAAFDSIQNAKIVFSFTFAGPDSLTMHGWLYKPGGGPHHKEFDSLPNFRLANSKASKDYTYGIGTYFGNLDLSSDVYAKLKIALRNADIKYVVFAPYKLGNNIGYKVCVTKDNMSIMSVMAVVDPIPDSDLNPSPPKNTSN